MLTQAQWTGTYGITMIKYEITSWENRPQKIAWFESHQFWTSIPISVSDSPLPMPQPYLPLHPPPNKMVLTTSDSLCSCGDDVRIKQVVNMEMLINPSIKKVIKTDCSWKRLFQNWAKWKLELNLRQSFGKCGPVTVWII